MGEVRRTARRAGPGALAALRPRLGQRVTRAACVHAAVLIRALAAGAWSASKQGYPTSAHSCGMPQEPLSQVRTPSMSARYSSSVKLIQLQAGGRSSQSVASSQQVAVLPACLWRTTEAAPAKLRPRRLQPPTQASLVRVRQRVRGNLVALGVGLLHRRTAARVAALLAHKLRAGWLGGWVDQVGSSGGG